MKLEISNITPLLFRPALGDPLATELQFSQRWGRYDHIIVQAYGDASATVTAKVYDALTDAQIVSQTCTSVSLADGGYLYHTELPVLSEGFYYATLTGGGASLRSHDFEVTQIVETDDEWALVEYGGYRNDTPLGAGFVVGGVRTPYVLRVPAGFKPQGWEPSVEVETYRTQKQELRVLYSAPYDKYTLTIGTAAGVPVELLKLFEWLLSCEYVYIDGVRWVRSEGNTVQKQLVMQGAQMFTGSVVLERQPSLEDYPNDVYWQGDEYNDDFNDDFDN